MRAFIFPGQGAQTVGMVTYGGKLYAIDVQEGMLDILKTRAEKFRMKNVETVLSKESSIPLDDEIVDGAVLSGSLNEASRPRPIRRRPAPCPVAGSCCHPSQAAVFRGS